MQSNHQKNVASWKQGFQSADSLSERRIRCLQDSIAKKMWEMEGQIYEHRKEVSDHRTDMTSFNRERMLDINCLENTHDFPGIMNDELTQTDTDGDALKYIHKNTKCDIKVIEDLAGIIDCHKKRMPYLIERTEQLEIEIITLDTQLEQQNKTIEDQYQRIRSIKEDMGPEGSNDLVECLDNLESINENIRRSSRTIECLKRVIHNWREERVLLKDMMIKERKEWIKFRNKIIVHLQRELDHHKKRTADYCEMMTEHSRLLTREQDMMKHFQLLDARPSKEIYKVQHLTEDMQRKDEQKEHVSRKIDNGRETVEQLSKEMKSLNKEITEVNKGQHKIEIESQFEEIQQLTYKFNDSVHENESFEILAKITSLHKDIMKWIETFESLKDSVYRWREKTLNFEDSIRELEETIQFRDQKIREIRWKRYQDEKENFDEILKEYQSARRKLETKLEKEKDSISELVTVSCDAARKILKRMTDLTNMIEGTEKKIDIKYKAYQDKLQKNMKHSIQNTDEDLTWQDINDLLDQWEELVGWHREDTATSCPVEIDNVKNYIKIREVRVHVTGGVVGVGGIGSAIAGGMALAVFGILTGGLALGVASAGGIAIAGHAIGHVIFISTAEDIYRAAEEVIKAFQKSLINK